MAGKGVVRSIKNIAKGFSDVQIKVREATSNDTWGPSGTLMNEIAQLTYNETDFIEIMDMIDRRLNDKGKNWRHVFKALLLLDYCLHVGSENVVLYAKENIYVVKTLKEFQHLEENGKDVGSNVRQKAKDITNLLMDDTRLKEERRQRQGMRDRMANVGDYLNESVRGLNGSPGQSGQSWNDETELQKALVESKRMAAEDAKSRRRGDDDLEKALKMSEQEALDEEKRKREKLEKDNAENLFGTPATFQPFAQQQQPFNPAFNNPYAQQQQQQQQQQNAFDQNNAMFSEPLITGFNPYQQQQQQPQNTQNPYQNQQFSTPVLQAQMTGFPTTNFNNQTPDFFSTNQQLPQQQPMVTGFNQNTPGLQNFPSFQSQNLQVPGATQFQTSMTTGTNPFSQMNQPQQQQQQQPLQPQQHDYSGLVFGQPQQEPEKPQFTSSPVFATAETSQSFSFTQQSSPVPSSSPAIRANTFPSPQVATAQQHKPQDAKYAKLNALLANKDDGMDTFGNTGNLRIPFGTGFANSLHIDQANSNNLIEYPQTSKNPFGQQQTESPKPQGQKSLLDLMQEQKQQQQMANNNNGFGFGQQQQQPFQTQQQQSGFNNGSAFF